MRLLESLDPVQSAAARFANALLSFVGILKRLLITLNKAFGRYLHVRQCTAQCATGCAKDAATRAAMVAPVDESETDLKLEVSSHSYMSKIALESQKPYLT